ncbi:hypothetical protein OH77DRAFT_1423044 [Trametes cingulata]|nr:hypothetical protein OH77DRAFT_1423044 [Trametes cingulata]
MVCTDQWLVTHVDPSWPVSQLKHVLLQKFSREEPEAENNRRSIPVSPRKARRRSLSPITFAAPLRKTRLVVVDRSASASSNEDEDPEDEENEEGVEEEDDIVFDVNKSFTDAHRYKYNTRPSTSTASDTFDRLLDADSAGTSQEAAAWLLITFSTTQILEDRFSLEWYGIYPDELLELHPLSHSFVSLPRFSLDAYIAPYFAAKVWALRMVGNTLEATLRDFGVPRDHQSEDDIPDASPRSPLLRAQGKKKITLEWKERWAIVHQGIFSLCKERHDTHAAFQAPLSSMLSIQDGSNFDLPSRSSRRTRSLPTRQLSASSASDLVCIKFLPEVPRRRTMSHDSLSPPYDRFSSDVSSPPAQSPWWRRGSRDASATVSSSLASSASALMGSPSGSGLAEMWDALARRGSRSGLDELEDEGEDAVWIVLDMLSSAAASHLLRVLHRSAPSKCDSSFLPSRPPSPALPSPIVFSTRTSSPMSASDLPTPGPSSSYTFPPAPSSSSSSPAVSPFPPSTPSHLSHNAYPFPNSPVGSAPPTRPVTPARPPQLHIDTHALDRGVPYPEWRLALVRKARRAGLGAVGRAMELVMFGDEEEDEDEEADDLAIEWARRLSAMTASPVDPPAGSCARPRSGRHVSDSAVQFVVESPAGEFDAPEPSPPVLDDSDESEAEWEGWLDVAIAQRRREQMAARVIQRTDTLETAVPGDLYWGTGWNAYYGDTGTPSPAFSTPENERGDPWGTAHSREQSGSEVELDAEGDASSAHSNDFLPSSRPTSYYGYPPAATISGSRGRRVKRGAVAEGGGRTLSSYSSADSLLKRTMRSAIGGSVKAKRSSASYSELSINVPPDPPLPRSASASPPLSRPSLASLRSMGSERSRPQSPLCAQVHDNNGSYGQPSPQEARHPIPLPGMPMVPSGYTTFRHSALYARSSRTAGSRGSMGPAEREERAHAGLEYGQSMQRIPVPMSMMMTTVSSTVSVGTGKAAAATSR